MIKYKQYPFSWKLGWSYSRYNKFKTCKRKYYYTYYGRHTQDPGKIATLKELTSLHLELGHIVHKAIKLILKKALTTKDSIDQPAFKRWVNREVHKTIRHSHFFEDYYSEQHSEKKTFLVENATKQIFNFVNSDRYKELKELVYNNGSDIIIDPEGYGEVRIADIKAYAKVDFCYSTPEDLLIIDWKTGRERTSHIEQLSIYIAAVLSMYPDNRLPQNIKAVAAYPKDRYSEVELDEVDIQDVVDLIVHQKEEMENYLLDVEENIPQDIKEFPKQEKQKICDRCNFKEMCLTSS